MLIAGESVDEMLDSVLELRRGGLPLPRGGATGKWRYRHAVRPEGATDLDHQVVADFLSYEKRHGRSVRVLADPEFSGWRTWQPPRQRPRPDDFATQCCAHMYPGGCADALVCHGAPAPIAARILAEGRLRCAVAVTGRTAAQLAAASTWGEPGDYFEHVMFANGRCLAPEAVACSRLFNRDLMPADLTPGYPPTVGFYFRWETLARSPAARFDGVHPVKIYQELSLSEVLVAVVMHASQSQHLLAANGSSADRVVVLGLDRPTPEAWTAVARSAAHRLA